MTSVKEKAYAKINLFLDVIERRDDGFHSISTVMHSLSLCDDITVSVSGRNKRSVQMFLDGNRRLPTDGKNIAVAAAQLFLDTLCLDREVTIKLYKRIPISAGLAGGSTDAAAVLRGMNKLFGRPLSEKMLLSLAAKVGSDVPYCLRGGTALCEGRGERITRLPDAIRLYTVVAVANEHVSTPVAYSTLDEIYNNFDGTVSSCGTDACSEIINSASTGILPKQLYNIFESAILPRCPGAKGLKERLTLLGATHALMSGSGPSVFGIFSTEKAARAAEKTLRDEGITAFFAKSI